MTELELYDKALELYYELAKEAKIDNPDKYFDLTDYDKASVYVKKYNLTRNNDAEKKAYLFAQICYHEQNSSFTTSIIKFQSNAHILKPLLCDFNVEQFCKRYGKMDTKDMAEQFYNKGIIWDKSKSKSNAPGTVERYCEKIKLAALYIRYKSVDDIKNELLQYVGPSNIKQLISYTKKTIFPAQAGTALVYDFLKEFSEEFNYLGKPDAHIKNIINAYYKCNLSKESEIMNFFNKLLTKINEGLKNRGDDSITAYKLDRILYILGTANFFLDYPDPKERELISMM